MCGRYTLTVSASILAEVFDADLRLEHVPRFNIAPTQTVPILRADDTGHRRIDGARWGLIPHWADDASIGNRLINARSETAASKPAFRGAFRCRRCLIPADGFYEWLRVDGRKQPYLLRFRDRRVFAFAGLWERWTAPSDSSSVVSCTILTTSPSPTVAPIHDRMPVILPDSAWDRWTSPDDVAVDDLRTLLRLDPDDDLEAVEVSTRVNSPSNDGPELLAPLS